MPSSAHGDCAWLRMPYLRSLHRIHTTEDTRVPYIVLCCTDINCCVEDAHDIGLQMLGQSQISFVMLILDSGH